MSEIHESIGSKPLAYGWQQEYEVEMQGSKIGGGEGYRRQRTSRMAAWLHAARIST